MEMNEVMEKDAFFQRVSNILKQHCPGKETSVRHLREVCFRYALKAEWVRAAVVSESKSKLPIVLQNLNDEELWNAYLLAIQFTSKDLLKMKKSENQRDRELYNTLTGNDHGEFLVAPINGRPSIEGRIINTVYQTDIQFEPEGESYPLVGGIDRNCENKSVNEDAAEENNMKIKKTKSKIKKSEKKVKDDPKKSKNDKNNKNNLKKNKKSNNGSILIESPSTSSETFSNLKKNQSNLLVNPENAIKNSLSVNRNLNSTNPIASTSKMTANSSQSTANLLSSPSLSFNNPSNLLEDPFNSTRNQQKSPKQNGFITNPFKNKPKNQKKFSAERKNEIFWQSSDSKMIRSEKGSSHRDYESKLKVNDRLCKFISSFVMEFEAKLVLLLLISEGEVLHDESSNQDSLSIKIGQICGGVIFGAVGGVIGVSQIGLGANFGAKMGEKVVHAISAKIQTSNINSVIDLMEFYQKEKLEVRKVLAEVGFDLFQGFEYQFMHVLSDDVHLLAIDAVHRIFNRLSKNRSSDLNQNLHNVLIKGILAGKSKINDKDLTLRGLKIVWRGKANEQMRTTANLFNNCGITNDGKFYKLKNVEEIVRFRRLFIGEDWSDLHLKLEQVTPNEPLTEHHYAIDTKQIKTITKKILMNIGDEEMTEERIKCVIEESKTELLEEIFILKRLNKDFAQGLQKVSEIEAYLKSLNLETFVNNFKLCFKNSHVSSLDVKVLMEKMNEMSKKIDKMYNFMFSDSQMN